MKSYIAPAGKVWPPALRHKLGIPEDEASSSSPSDDSTTDNSSLFPMMVSTSTTSSSYTANQLRKQIHKSYAALTSIQRQLYRGEEAYFEDSYAHRGNLFGGWDNIWIDNHTGGNSNGDSSGTNGADGHHGGGGQQHKSSILKRMPNDYRWFSSSCTTVIPTGDGRIAALGRASLAECPPAHLKSSPLKASKITDLKTQQSSASSEGGAIESIGIKAAPVVAQGRDKGGAITADKSIATNTTGGAVPGEAVVSKQTEQQIQSCDVQKVQVEDTKSPSEVADPIVLPSVAVSKNTEKPFISTDGSTSQFSTKRTKTDSPVAVSAPSLVSASSVHSQQLAAEMCPKENTTADVTSLSLDVTLPPTYEVDIDTTKIRDVQEEDPISAQQPRSQTPASTPSIKSFATKPDPVPLSKAVENPNSNTETKETRCGAVKSTSEVVPSNEKSEIPSDGEKEKTETMLPEDAPNIVENKSASSEGAVSKIPEAGDEAVVTTSTVVEECPAKENIQDMESLMPEKKKQKIEHSTVQATTAKSATSNLMSASKERTKNQPKMKTLTSYFKQQDKDVEESVPAADATSTTREEAAVMESADIETQMPPQKKLMTDQSASEDAMKSEEPTNNTKKDSEQHQLPSKSHSTIETTAMPGAQPAKRQKANCPPAVPSPTTRRSRKRSVSTASASKSESEEELTLSQLKASTKASESTTKQMASAATKKAAPRRTARKRNLSR